MEFERHRRKTTDKTDGGDLRDLIAQRLGGNISGRTVDRLLQLIRLPAPIHRAVSAGELPMTKALQLEKLPPKVLADIADRISAGESARTVVDAFLPRKKSGRQETPTGLYQMLIDFLTENLSLLEAMGEELTGTAVSHELAASILGRSAIFFNSMREREQAAHEEDLNDIRELIA